MDSKLLGCIKNWKQETLSSEETLKETKSTETNLMMVRSGVVKDNFFKMTGIESFSCCIFSLFFNDVKIMAQFFVLNISFHFFIVKIGK